jgi:tRNA A58 N-methylase Trm61
MNLGHTNKSQHGSIEVKSKIGDQLINIMKLSQSDVVLDAGSGDGYYSFRFAEHCAKVVAIDMRNDGFKSQFYLKPNIEAINADVCNWIINNNLNKITHVFFSNSFHDMKCQREILSALSQKLPNEANIVMIEFYPETSFGLPKSIRFSKEELKSKVEAFGFMEKNFFDLNTHYLILFKKAK